MKHETVILRILISCFIILAIVSCKKENVAPKNQKISENYKIIDTTIVLSNIYNSENNYSAIKTEEAEKFLYKYFKTQGALPRSEIKDYSKENLCIDYDTIYNLKSNKSCCAIIRYWLKPADLNGTCIQPNMAIISKTKKGLKITNEEFVNSDFGIDSIADNLIVYGYKFDCAERKVLKKYKLKLEIK